MQSYIKLFFSFSEETSALTDAEIGRIIRQMLAYAESGDTDSILEGNERFLFPVYKSQIDRDVERYSAVSEQRAANGRAGGKKRAKASEERKADVCLTSEANASKSSKCFSNEANQANAYFAKQTKQNRQEEEKEEDKDKEKGEGEDISNNNSSSRGIPPISPTETVESYVAGNIDRMSAGNFEELIAFMEDIPKELIRYAVDECCANGKRTFGYLRSILQSYLRDNIRTVGEAKARSERHKATRVAMGTSSSVQKTKNPALDYAQRSYAEKDFSDLFVDLGG